MFATSFVPQDGSGGGGGSMEPTGGGGKFGRGAPRSAGLQVAAAKRKQQAAMRAGTRGRGSLTRVGNFGAAAATATPAPVFATSFAQPAISAAMPPVVPQTMPSYAAAVGQTGSGLARGRGVAGPAARGKTAARGAVAVGRGRASIRGAFGRGLPPGAAPGFGAATLPFAAPALSNAPNAAPALFATSFSSNAAPFKPAAAAQTFLAAAPAAPAMPAPVVTQPAQMPKAAVVSASATPALRAGRPCPVCRQEDCRQRTALTVADLPPEYQSEGGLRELFQKYGAVRSSQFKLNPRNGKMEGKVIMQTHAAAVKAKKGAKYQAKCSIFWDKPLGKREPTITTTTAAAAAVKPALSPAIKFDASTLQVQEKKKSGLASRLGPRAAVSPAQLSARHGGDETTDALVNWTPDPDRWGHAGYHEQNSPKGPQKAADKKLQQLSPPQQQSQKEVATTLEAEDFPAGLEYDEDADMYYDLDTGFTYDEQTGLLFDESTLQYFNKAEDVYYTAKQLDQLFGPQEAQPGPVIRSQAQPIEPAMALATAAPATKPGGGKALPKGEATRAGGLQRVLQVTGIVDRDKAKELKAQKKAKDLVTAPPTPASALALTAVKRSQPVAVATPPVQLPSNNVQPAPTAPEGLSDLFGASKKRRAAAATMPAEEMSRRLAVLLQEEERARLQQEQDYSSRDVNTARYIKGTCPDMCPVVERYRRAMIGFGTQDGHVWPFEAKPGTLELDHVRAIKEYRKEAADSAMALASHLRPVPVLQQTMLFLCHHVINLLPDHLQGVSKADWHKFLWDRTRAIRKDISIQQISSPEAVELLEQIVRFHILSSHLLAEAKDYEDFHNSEQLVKSLTSLQTLYTDLLGADLPRRAEFCGYEILLNIGQGGNVLRSVQYLPAEVRTASPVQFAIKVFVAASQDNYARFFLLAKQANALAASLLHRHFFVVRSRALTIMQTAFTTAGQQRPGTVPVTDLMRLLAFEDQQEAVDFVLAHGLDLDPTQQNILLDTSSIPTVDEPPPRRCTSWILQKMDRSLGELVYGRPLPALQHVVPHDLFDGPDKFTNPLDIQAATTVAAASNYAEQQLKLAAERAGANFVREQQQREQQQQQAQHAMAKRRTQQLEQAAVLGAQLVAEVCASEGRAIADRFTLVQQHASRVTSELVLDTVTEHCDAVAREIAAAHHASRRQRLVVQVADSTWQELVSYILTDEVARVAAMVFHQEQLAHMMWADLLTETAVDVRTVVESMWAKAVSRQQEDALIVRWRQARTLRRWRWCVREKRAVRSFPPCQTMQSLQVVVERFRQSTSDQKRKRSTSPTRNQCALLSPDAVATKRAKIMQQLQAKRVELPRLRAVWDPLPNLAQLIFDNLAPMANPSPRFWKLAVTAAADAGGGGGDFVAWVCAKLSLPKPPVANLSVVDSATRTLGDDRQEILHVCAQWLSSTAADAKALAVCNAVLFLLPCPADSKFSLAYWVAQSKELMRTASCLSAGAPVLVLHNWPPSELPDRIDQYLQLTEVQTRTGIRVSLAGVQAEALLPDVLPGEWATAAVASSLGWLAAETLPGTMVPASHIAPLGDLVDALVRHHLLDRSAAGGVYDSGALVDPAHVLARFNACLARAIDIVGWCEREVSAWPASQFSAVCPPAPLQTASIETVRKLLLHWQLPDAAEYLDTETSFGSCLAYVAGLVDQHGMQLAPLLSAIKSLLTETERSGATEVPWTRVIEHIIYYYLAQLVEQPEQVSAQSLCPEQIMAPLHMPQQVLSPDRPLRRKRTPITDEGLPETDVGHQPVKQSRYFASPGVRSQSFGGLDEMIKSERRAARNFEERLQQAAAANGWRVSTPRSPPPAPSLQHGLLATSASKPARVAGSPPVRQQRSLVGTEQRIAELRHCLRGSRLQNEEFEIWLANAASVP